jgi:hypothetical protein
LKFAASWRALSPTALFTTPFEEEVGSSPLGGDKCAES